MKNASRILDSRDHAWNTLHSTCRQHKQRLLSEVSISNVALDQTNNIARIDISTPASVVNCVLKLLWKISGMHCDIYCAPHARVSTLRLFQNGIAKKPNQTKKKIELSVTKSPGPWYCKNTKLWLDVASTKSPPLKDTPWGVK